MHSAIRGRAKLVDNVLNRKMIPMQIIMFALLFVLGCATDKVAWDLTEYVNQGVLNITALEKEALEKYAMARGEHYTTEQALYNVLEREVIPPYRRYLYLLKQIKPETEEVIKLHRIYIAGTENICNGFELKMIGLRENEERLIRAGNEKIEKGRIQNEQWRKEMETLSDAHQSGWVMGLWNSP